MKFIRKSYCLYTKDIHRIWCRSAKYLWKSKFSSESGSGSGSGSWCYFGFQYQTYISYTHQILFGPANSFERYCVHMKSPRTYTVCPKNNRTLYLIQKVRLFLGHTVYVHPDRQTDRRKFFWLVLSSKTYKSWTFVKRREFFFHSCDYNTFSFYILRMWWESKK